MATGLLAAVLLHAAIVAATLFTFRHHLEIADETPPVVPVDLVKLADKNNITPTVQRVTKPKPVEDVKPPELVTPPAPTPPPPPQPAHQEPAPAPPPPPKMDAEPLPEPAPKPLAKPKPEPKAETVAKAEPPPPKAIPKPEAAPPAPAKPDKPAKQPKSDDFSALLNKLTSPPAAAPPRARVADRTIKGFGAMNAMTMDLIEALRSQIAQCWSPPVGAPNPEALKPAFRMFLRQDGSVAQATSPDLSSGDPYLRAAAEAAHRAIMTCQPYKLPGDKYNVWQDITVDFDPTKMVQ